MRYAPCVILVAGCALLWNAHAQRAVPIEGPLASVLADAPGFEIVEQTITANERRVAGMTDYVARAYRRDSTVAFTTFVSYYDKQTQGKTIHSPRNCLPGAGWEIVSGGLRELVIDGRVHIVNRYVLKNGSATALAYYWYQGRGRVTANEYRVKWNLLRDAALYGRTEEALVRVVVPVRVSSATQGTAAPEALLQPADDRAGEVARRLIGEVERVLPKIG